MKARRLFNIVLLLVLILMLTASGVVGAITARAQSTIPPSGYSLVISRPAVALYSRTISGQQTDYVQIANLSQGAKVTLRSGAISNPGTGKGSYKGGYPNNPSFLRQSLQEAWTEFATADPNAFCITNGAFFSTDEIEPPLAFPLKVDGKYISEGYAGPLGGKEEYPSNKLMLEIWPDKVEINPLLSKEDLYDLTAPNILAGLTVDVDKRLSEQVGRTFAGIIDANGDGTSDTILIFTGLEKTQPYAVGALAEFGVVDQNGNPDTSKMIMFDGGGSTQVICNNQPVITSTANRTIPQTLAVSAAEPSGPVDVALIIDSSGSMTSNDPGNKRLEAARAYLTGAAAGDYVGIIDFDSYARLASPLLRLPDNKNPLYDAINTINSSGGTNIGVGIQEGCNALTNASSPNLTRAAILLTDGQGSFADQDQCFKIRGWPIYTFGFGSANDELLTNIANNTGGEFARLPTSSFICEFQRVRAKIAGVEPSPCTSYLIGPLEFTKFYVIVESGQEQVSFSLSWIGSDVELSLVSPSGRIINRSSADIDVTHDLGAAYEIYTLLKPEPGEWEVTLFGADVPAGGEEAVFSFTSIPMIDTTSRIYLPSITNGSTSIDNQEQIVFVSRVNGNSEIYSINPDGTGLTRLTNNSSEDVYPNYSPDGSKIVFSSKRTGKEQVYTMLADGSQQTRLLVDTYDDGVPEWSPDGTKIAFTRYADYDGYGVRGEVFVMNSDGSDVKRLTTTSGKTGSYTHGCWSSGWSPDSTKILYYCYVGNDQIWMMKSDGSNKQLILDDSYWNAFPKMSPDGKKIVFVSWRYNNYDAYTVNTDGSSLTRLTTHTTDEWAPDWSPDGKMILFEANRDGRTQVYWMNADGTQQTRITDNTSYAGQARWRP